MAMIIIGSFIGGLTNSLAIKMLFRPYKQKYIGKWKIPFTPGVIPKRRATLAKQLGRLVSDHLVTMDSIQNKLEEPKLKKQVQTQLQIEWEKFLSKSITVQELMDRFRLPVNKEKILNQFGDMAVQQYEAFIKKNRHTKLKKILSTISQEEKEQLVDGVISYAHQKALSVLTSSQTKYQMERIILNYAESKGFFGNMILSMFSSEDLAEKIQHLLIHYIKSDDGYQTFQRLIQQEWSEWEGKDLAHFSYILESATVKTKIHHLARTSIPIDQWMNKDIQSILQPFSKTIHKQVLPFLVDSLFDKLHQQLPQILKQLEMNRMVEEQVASFPIERIEQMMLSISKKELKWITYLGAFLGGVIGLIQGFLFVGLG